MTKLLSTMALLNNAAHTRDWSKRNGMTLRYLYLCRLVDELASSRKGEKITAKRYKKIQKEAKDGLIQEMRWVIDDLQGEFLMN